jgi:mRNA interferase RelE/StbE
LSAKYKIAETKTFSKHVANLEFKQVYGKLANFVYLQLRDNPHFGTNIKKLKGEYEGIYRYRIGSNRVFYIIDETSKIVYLIHIQKRKDSYK